MSVELKPRITILESWVLSSGEFPSQSLFHIVLIRFLITQY
jgi:hypothetical protein